MKQGFSFKRLLAPLWTGQNRFTTLSILIICAMFGIWTFTDTAQTKMATWTPKSDTRSQIVTSVGMPSIGGPFNLQRALPGGSVQVFTEENLKDKYSLLFFGFTYCPDICPMELSKFDVVYDMLPVAEKEKLQVIVVSIDPTRDTPQVMYDYVTAFNEKFIPLTGTEESVRQAADAYLVYYSVRKEANQTEDYEVDHSGYSYLMGPDGKYVTHFSTGSSIEDIKKELTKQLSQ